MNLTEKIWDDFRQGESYALSHIYYQNVQLLYRYGLKFSNNEELIKDSIQELFFDLIRTREKLGKTDNVKFYLMASLKRKLVLAIKKDSLTVSVNNLNYLEPEIIYSAEKAIIENEEITQRDKIIQIGLGKLSKKQREILFYRFNCELEYEEICEIMNLKYDSARKQVSRALKTLKSILPENKIFIFLTLFCGRSLRFNAQ